MLKNNEEMNKYIEISNETKYNDKREIKEINGNKIPLIAIINWIKSLINSKIEFNFSPNKILQFIKNNGKDKFLNIIMNILRKEIKELLNDLNQNKLKGILNHLKLEKFLITILYAKNKCGFSFDINTNGLTSAIDKLILSNKS